MIKQATALISDSNDISCRLRGRPFAARLLRAIRHSLLCSFGTSSYSKSSFIYQICFQKFFVPSVRQIRRLESQQRSNLLSVLSQNIQGAASIRAFQRLKNTVIAFCEVVDEYVRCRILQPASYCWLTVRLELLGNLLVCFFF